MADKDFVVKNGIVTGTNNVTLGTAVTVTATGNVGIGNSTPIDKLSINGTVSAGNISVGTIASGNVNITGTVSSGNTNITGSVNATSHTVGTNFVANTLGVYSTGTVNAATVSIGTFSIVNSSGIYAPTVNAGSFTVGAAVTVNSTVVSVTGATINSTGLTTTANVSAAAFSSTPLTANSLGVYTPYAVNALSYNVGTASLANSSGFYTVGVVNSTSMNSGSFNVGTATLANAAGVYTVGIVNATTINAASHKIGTLFEANTLGVFAGSINASSVTVGTFATVNSSGLYGESTVTNSVAIGQYGSVGGGTVVNATVIAVGNSTVNTFVNSSILTLGGATVANSTGAYNAHALGGTAAASYAKLTGATFSGAVAIQNDVTVTGNLVVSGSTVTLNTATLDVKDLNITVAKGAATAAATDGAGLTVDNSNIIWNYDYAQNSWKTNVGIVSTANNFGLGSASNLWNVYANNVTAVNLYGNGAALTSISATTLGGNTAADIYAIFSQNNYVTSELNVIKANFQTTAGLAANVLTLTANNANFLGGTAAAGYQTTAGMSAYQTVAGMSSYQTTAGLAANVAVLAANSATYFGGQLASYYQVALGYTPLGSSGNQVINNGTLKIGSALYLYNSTNGVDLKTTDFEMWSDGGGIYSYNDALTASGTILEWARLTGTTINGVKIGGTFIAAPNYINFGISAYGNTSVNAASFGYGLRNNAGAIEYKNSGGAWTVMGLPVGGASRTISGGFSVTASNLGTVTTGTVTLDPANGNYQYLNCNGTFSIAAPATDCAIDVFITNGTAAGTLSLSSFSTTTGSTGAVWVNTSTAKWLLSVRRINGTAVYNWSGPWT